MAKRSFKLRLIDALMRRGYAVDPNDGGGRWTAMAKPGHRLKFYIADTGLLRRGENMKTMGGASTQTRSILLEEVPE
jgi:hypothetical protein